MNILVTGGAGFIGSHIVDRLVGDGHRVTIADSLVTGKKENINRKAVFRKVDIRSGKMDSIFRSGRFGAVFHLAAQMDVRKSVSDPIYDADVNIMGGLNLLENCRKYGVGRFIFISSGGVMYGECASDPPSEYVYPRPLCPYGDSKLALEFYLNFYGSNFGVKCVTLRLGNVYGPRQDPYGEAGVVAIFCGAMLSGTEVKIFGDGEQVRDYIYIDDVVDANMLALNRGAGIYNVGTGKSRSVNDIFGTLKKITGFAKEAVYESPRPGELNRSCLDVGRAFKDLGWRAETGLEEGLKKTVEYFKSKN
ncbi:MAG: NAD-dependent epimerase/dehydratase family protein [Elusimicrobia bacterium]|nr:NAD-dependent epimerase/dehydratase family protein [Elusimicrobiota bacterium]